MPNLSLRPMPGNRRGGGAAPTPSELVEAMLFGTDGFAIDPSDVATMWQDTGTATPVTTAADPVGHIRSKWGNTQYDFTQGTGASRPAWDGFRALVSDGVDDTLARVGSVVNTLTDKASGAVAAKYRRLGAGSGAAIIAYLSTVSTANPRFRLDVQGGRLRFVGRRLDADAQSVFDNAGAGNGGTVDTDYTVITQLDYAGTGSLSTRINGAASTLSGTIASPANTSNTNSQAADICGRTGGFFQGRLGRTLFLPFAPSGAQQTLIEAWLDETGALT